ncbi:MAG: PQQ-dependent sugar dehydrogenase [Ekhidna sp.]
MKNYILIVSLFISLHNFGQSEHDEIRKPIEKFIYGTIYNSPDSILDAFYPGAQMFLYTGSDQIRKLTAEEYASFYNKPAGTINNRPSKIISIEQVLDVAYAKVEVTIPYWGNRYNDLLLLKKFENGWKIVSKCTSAEPIPKRAEEMVAQPQKEIILDGLNHPWSMAFLSETDVLITEKDGDLLHVDLHTGEQIAIEGLPKDVARAVTIDTSKVAKGVFPSQAHGLTRSFNAGWFQVLLDPDFKDNSYIYLSYAAENKQKQSTTKVIRGVLKENKLSKVETLFEAAPYTHGLFHYGGGMIFGSDKKLYITIGERNYEEYLNPPTPLAQDVSDKRGKVIRINSDGSIPSDNPDFGPNAIDGLYAMGIRASQGLTIHPQTQDIWFSEHGTMQGDELNIMKKGANYGWPYQTSGKYRSSNYNPTIPKGLEFTNPIHFWDKTIAPTGLAFYHGRAFPQWEGDLLVPGLSRGGLWRMSIENDKVVSAEELLLNDRVRLRKVAISPKGQLYLLTDEENGKLIKLVNGKNN